MGESLGVAVSFSAGLFSFLSPCVLPLFPSYVSFITGMSVADLTTDLSAVARRRVLIHALAFVLGFSLVFVALGASFSAAGQFLLDYREWIRLGGGVLIVVFGLYIVGVFAWLARQRPMVALTLGLAVAPLPGGDAPRGAGPPRGWAPGGGGPDPGRGGRARLHQLLRRPQRLGRLAHPRLAPQAALAACASTSASPRRPPTSAQGSTRSAWRGRSTTRSSRLKPRG